MTDDRPEPKYGQYAPASPNPSPTPAAPPSPTPPPVPTAPTSTPRRTWDVALTTALLLLGVYDVVTSFPHFVALGDTLRSVYALQGLGEFSSDALAGSMGIAINVVRVILLLVAIAISLLLISRNRLAFWVPLTAGVVAGIVVMVCAGVVLVNDPAFVAYVNSVGS